MLSQWNLGEPEGRLFIGGQWWLRRGTSIVLWTAAHPCPLKFLDHLEDSANPSPMQVFAIDPNTLKSTMVFQNNGDLISTASTVLHFEDRLYIFFNLWEIARV